LQTAGTQGTNRHAGKMKRQASLLEILGGGRSAAPTQYTNLTSTSVEDVEQRNQTHDTNITTTSNNHSVLNHLSVQ